MSTPVISSVYDYLKTQKATLVSVFPIELETTRRHNGFTVYKLDAAPRDGYTKLEIAGVVDYGIDYLTEPAQLLPRPIPIEVVSDCLLREFTKSMLDATFDAGPGIAQVGRIISAQSGCKTCNGTGSGPGPNQSCTKCGGSKVVTVMHNDGGTEPTKQELDVLRDRQTRYFRHLVDDADTKFGAGKIREIGTLHRAAARWLGVEDRPWVQEITQRQTKPCMACGETILKVARVCKTCNTDLVRFFIDTAAKAEADPFVGAIVANMRRPVPPPPPVRPKPELQAV